MGLLVALVGLRMGWECWGARFLSVGFLAVGFMGVGNSGGWDFWLRWWDFGGVGILMGAGVRLLSVGLLAGGFMGVENSGNVGTAEGSGIWLW